MLKTQNGLAVLMAPFSPVPAVVRMAEELGRYAELDPKIQEAASLMERRLGEVDGTDRAEYIGPLFWSWARNIPFCPPGRPGPHRPGPWSGIPAETIMHDGSRLLPATEAFLDTFLDPRSMGMLSNELARWSRSSTRNTHQIGAIKEEYRQFQDECGKLREQRKAIIDDIVAVGLIAVGVAAVAGMIREFAHSHPQ